MVPVAPVQSSRHIARVSCGAGLVEYNLQLWLCRSGIERRQSLPFPFPRACPPHLRLRITSLSPPHPWSFSSTPFSLSLPPSILFLSRPLFFGCRVAFHVSIYLSTRGTFSMCVPCALLLPTVYDSYQSTQCNVVIYMYAWLCVCHSYCNCI